MQARDVMTTEVATVAPDATIEDIAQVLMARNISGVPVVEDGKVVGVVSEGDLIRRQEIGTEPHPSWWLQLLSPARDRARDYVKSHGTTAREVMTRDVATVTEDTPLGEIAALFERRHIKRVPVVRDGKLVGIVSRADLLRAFASAARKVDLPRSADDAELRERVERAIRDEARVDDIFVSVIVADGTVHLWGAARSQEEADAAVTAAATVVGRDKVESHLGVVTSAARTAIWGY